jgi:hypothetical protein
VQCVNTASVVRLNLINIAHSNLARDFSTAISAMPVQRPFALGRDRLFAVEQY